MRLVWAADFERIDAAYAYEKMIQGWRREKRIALIELAVAPVRARTAAELLAEQSQ